MLRLAVEHIEPQKLTLRPNAVRPCSNSLGIYICLELGRLGEAWIPNTPRWPSVLERRKRAQE